MSTRTRPSTRRLVVVGGLVSLLVAGVLSVFASASPDGLEHVAGTLGFADTARDSAAAGSPLADYGVGGISNGALSGGLAGVLGVLATAVVMAGLVLLLRRLGRGRG
ncbi:PDGLE domain-containing protein [uncultured Phycicoccus sp.]|uniref:PDGLE domain-containing protein n=1 Tax=uncultured Phycicoccus sp. TaxID=661422 RepID=UPI002622E730|nr:PDGLE domain-containing protein [uncultured Phycicoccus sp.]